MTSSLIINNYPLNNPSFTGANGDNSNNNSTDITNPNDIPNSATHTITPVGDNRNNSENPNSFGVTGVEGSNSSTGGRLNFSNSIVTGPTNPTDPSIPSDINIRYRQPLARDVPIAYKKNLGRKLRT